MNRVDSTAEIVPPLRPWQRRLYAGVACISGSAMLMAGLVQLTILARALRALPPTIEVLTGTPGLLLMGVAIMGFGLLALTTPDDVSASENKIRGGAKTRLNRAQWVVGIGLVCLLLFPLSIVALRIGTADYLESKGYHRQVIDVRGHSRFLTIHWTKGPSAQN